MHNISFISAGRFFPWEEFPSISEQALCAATDLSQEDTVHHLTGQAHDARTAVYSGVLDLMKHIVLSDVFMPGLHRNFCIFSEAACYKEDSELNKCELDPELISVLQQLLLNTPTHHHLVICLHTPCAPGTLAT